MDDRRPVERNRNLVKALSDLASNVSTPLRRALYDALLLYSRQSQAFEISDKLVFCLSSLESILLRNQTEPIQKNLGERMAYLVGDNVEGRKQIAKTVDEIYKIRSAFVHHGQTPKHIEILDRFLSMAWQTFVRPGHISIVEPSNGRLSTATPTRRFSRPNCGTTPSSASTTAR